MIQLLVHVITSIIEKKKNGCNLFGECKKGLEKMWRKPPEKKNTVPDTAGGMRNPADCLIIIYKRNADCVKCCNNIQLCFPIVFQADHSFFLGKRITLLDFRCDFFS